MATDTQKALVLEKKFGDFVLTTLPIPVPGPDEVIVKVEAAGLNPIDWKIQRYGIVVEEFPAVLGSDTAGEVVSLGERVSNVSKGDKVLFGGTYQKGDGSNSFQQYARAEAHTLAKIPDSVTFVEAATIPGALHTAWIGLYNKAPHGFDFEPPLTADSRGKHTGTPIVVLGGSGSVGQLVVQLAHASGLGPIITTSSLGHTEFLKSLGATHVLDRRLSNGALQAAVKDIIGTTPLKTVYDAVASNDTQKVGLDLLATGGQLAVVLPPAVDAPGGKTVIAVLGPKELPQNVQFIRTLYTKLTELLQEGIVKPNRAEVLPNGLLGVSGGLKRLEESKVSGIKLVALPQETR